MEYRQKILEYMEFNGPTLPVQVAKLLGKDIILGSAMLSEMASKGLVKISNIKVGGSPLYYKPGHEPKLLDFTSGLKEKEREVLELLKAKTVLEDATLNPLQRVILQSLKDFAIPITLKTETEQRLFWKWFLLPDENAKSAIIDLLSPPKVEKPLEKVTPAEVEKPKLEKRKKREQRQKTLVKKEEPQEEAAENIAPATETDDIGKKILDFFSTTQVKVLEQLPFDGKDRDFITECVTPIGKLRTFCRVITRKKIGEAELHAAVIKSSKHQLPLFLVVQGAISRSLQEKLDKDFAGILVKSLPE